MRPLRTARSRRSSSRTTDSLLRPNGRGGNVCTAHANCLYGTCMRMVPVPGGPLEAAEADNSIGRLERLDIALGRIRRLWEQPSVRAWIAAHIDVDEVDASVFRTLRAVHGLGPDGASVNGVAQLLRVDASTASRFLDRAQTARYVRRSASPADRRRSSFSLTDQGREQLDRLREQRMELLSTITSEWADDDVAFLVVLLERFDDSVEDRLRLDDAL